MSATRAQTSLAAKFAETSRFVFYVVQNTTSKTSHVYPVA